MVWIQIDDEVWGCFKKSWSLLGIKTEEKLVDLLEDQLWTESTSVLESAEMDLIDERKNKKSKDSKNLEGPEAINQKDKIDD